MRATSQQRNAIWNILETLWLTRADSRCRVGSEARNTCEKQVMEDLYVTVDRAALSGGHFVRAFARGRYCLVQGMDGKASVFWKMHSSTTVESVLLEPRARRHGTRSHALPYGFRYVSSTGHEKANERKQSGKRGKK